MESRSASWSSAQTYPGRSLTGLKNVSEPALRSLLDAARGFRERGLDAHATAAAGRQVALLFFEKSTRTRMSFESAAARVGAYPLVLSSESSSAGKGESLRDTARNLEAMGIELLVVRHPERDAAEFLSAELSIPVVNAGNGAGEHPTQALLDILTLEDVLGDLRGKRIAIVGDIAHSRVARSNLFGLRALGAQVVFCGPPTLVSPAWRELGVEVFHRLEPALEGAHAVMGLRLQIERLDRQTPAARGALRARFAVTRQWLEARPDLWVMHPGPVDRGVELSHEVADAPQSLIMAQVRNGIFVRMAVLVLLLRGARGASREPGVAVSREEALS